MVSRLVQDRPRGRGHVRDRRLSGFVTYDTEHHRIGVLGFPGIKEHVDGHAGMHHVAFTYADLGDLMHTYNRLKDEHEHHCRNSPSTTARPRRCITSTRTRTRSSCRSTTFPKRTSPSISTNGEFTSNPIGIKFDPDELFGPPTRPANPKRRCSSAPTAPRRPLTRVPGELVGGQIQNSEGPVGAPAAFWSSRRTYRPVH